MTTSKIWLGFGSLQQQSARRSRRWHQNISVDKSAGVKRLALSHQVTFLYPLWQRLFTTNISCVKLNEGTRGRVQDDDDEGDESFILRAPRGEARAAWPRRKVTPRDSMPPPPPPPLHISCSPEWTARGWTPNNNKSINNKIVELVWVQETIQSPFTSWRLTCVTPQMFWGTDAQIGTNNDV